MRKIEPLGKELLVAAVGEVASEREEGGMRIQFPSKSEFAELANDHSEMSQVAQFQIQETYRVRIQLGGVAVSGLEGTGELLAEWQLDR